MVQGEEEFTVPNPYRNRNLLDFLKEFSTEELIQAYVSSETITYADLVSDARTGKQF